MKQSSIIQLAVFYLILLLSNEGITVATNIRQTVGLRKNIQLSTSLNNIVNMMDSTDVDSFLEVEDMHGMSAEAYGTLEMIEMHKRQMEFWKSKLGISDYGVAWIAFLKGLVIGLLAYHFLIAA